MWPRSTCRRSWPSSRSRGRPSTNRGTGELLADALFTDPLKRLLRDGTAEGSLRRVDPVETATVLFNMAGWTYVHLRTGHR